MDRGPRIREARGASDFEACVALQRAVWGLADLEITSAIQLVATVHAGGQLLVAEDADGTIVAFCYAFAALRGGEPHLHSDMLAVRPDHRGRGLGARLKWAQREAALARGISLITWTFDPMQARNASLNLRRLGAVATELRRDFYGTTTSALHHGLPTDRLLVRWELDGDRVRRRRDVVTSAPASAELERPRVNEIAGSAGGAESSPPRMDLEAPEVLLEIPGDWDALCATAPPGVAAAWQRRVSDAFEAYLSRGYLAIDFLTPVIDGDARGLYVLSREGW
jgi:predicted GNAT superfamily acetyltransferase